jgi:hypothetical protein
MGMNIKKFQYSYPTRASLWERQVDWMYKNIGILGEDWDYRKTTFWFTTEQDKVLFILRWS